MQRIIIGKKLSDKARKFFQNPLLDLFFFDIVMEIFPPHFFTILKVHLEVGAKKSEQKSAGISNESAVGF